MAKGFLLGYHQRRSEDLSKSGLPIISRANLLSLFVEGAQAPDGTMRNCALKALSFQLGLFRGHKGKFTSQQIEKLLEAAKRYIRDPAHQVDLTLPALVRKGGRQKGASTTLVANE